MREFIEGSGVYVVPVSKLPADSRFLRDPNLCGDEDLGPLLHICEQDLDPAAAVPSWMILTDEVKWDFYHGFYFCKGCKELWDEDDEEGLRAIWSDGYGTGDEGHA